MPQQIVHTFSHVPLVAFIGQTAFTIDASDAENDPLTFSLTGPNSVYFTVNSATGVVTVNRQLDREVWCGRSEDTHIFKFWLCVYVFYQLIYGF